MSISIPTWLEQVSSEVEAIGLVRSPGWFDLASQPKSLIEKGFVISLVTENTNLYEGGEMLGVRHTLTLRYAWLIAPKRAIESLSAAQTMAERLIGRLRTRDVFPDVLVDWVSTTFEPNPSREYLIFDVTFTCQHDWQPPQ